MTSRHTLALLRPHALEHQTSIEMRIFSSDLSIVHSAPMHLDARTVDALLARSALSSDRKHDCAHGLVGDAHAWVLEATDDAVKRWTALMGEEDPQAAKAVDGHSLRAVYGLTRSENAVYGSETPEVASYQVDLLFPNLDLHTSESAAPATPASPEPVYVGGADDAASIMAIHTLERTPSARAAPTKSASIGATPVRRTPPPGAFRARPLPASHKRASITPALSRTAALRMGLPPPAPPTHSPAPAATPAQPKRVVPLPKSLAAPTVPVRPTRASSLRAGGPVSPPRVPPSSRCQGSTSSDASDASSSAAPDTPPNPFAQTPGHKRFSLQIVVPSTAPPRIAPRQSRASMLRAGGGAPGAGTDSSSTPRRERAEPNWEGVPGHKRRETISVPSTAPPVVAARQNRSSMLRAAKMSGLGLDLPTHTSASVSRSPSVMSPPRPASSAGSATTATSSTAAKKSAHQRQPSIVPRTNRSALLRAQQQKAA